MAIAIANTNELHEHLTSQVWVLTLIIQLLRRACLDQCLVNKTVHGDRMQHTYTYIVNSITKGSHQLLPNLVRSSLFEITEISRFSKFEIQKIDMVTGKIL